MSDKIRLLSWIQGDGPNHVFAIRVGLSDSVIELKEAIREKNVEFQYFSANYLEPWKFSLPLASLKDDSRHLIKLEQGQRLTFEMKISDIWESEPPRGILSVILPRLTIPQPTIDAHWSPRSDTVRRLFDTLMAERLVHVRGIPGCGKTTLKKLLHAHILKQEPAASVYVQDSWPQDSSLYSRFRLLDPACCNPSVITFLLFDEGEDSYGNGYFWNSFLKDVQDRLYKNHRVILFCSYGSASPCPVLHKIRTSIILPDAARVSLWPTESSVGLLLNRLEFDEVVARHCPKLHVHPDILNYIFNWTAGHAGAIAKLLLVFSFQRPPQQHHFKINPPHLLISQLLGGEAFNRGLPLHKDLSEDPSVAAFFRNLIRDGEIKARAENREMIDKCHRKGWLHTYEVNSSITFATCYTFASPVHAAAVSWTLPPSNDMPRYPSILALCVAVISNFKPSQMHTPIRRVDAQGAPSTIGQLEQLPEAQYCDEFYRSLFTATAGTVCISPQFASGKGAHIPSFIDFFIPTVKWGIEIIRDGDRLEEFPTKFRNSGGYSAWLQTNNLTDFVLLNCCMSISQKAHPDIPNLFHVVFGDRFQEVNLYDNEVNKVGGTIMLLENHCN